MNYLPPQEDVFLKVLLREVVLSKIRNKNSQVFISSQSLAKKTIITTCVLRLSITCEH